MSTWTTVDTELPDSNETVLVFAPEADPPVWMGYIEDGEWWLVDAYRARVTHWMPLPEPPEFAA